MLLHAEVSGNSGGEVEHPWWAAALRFVASLVIAWVGVFGALVLSETSDYPTYYLAGVALLVAGIVSGRASAVAIPLVLALLLPAISAGSALYEGVLFEVDRGDADSRTHAQLAIFFLFLALFAAVPATLAVASGVLVRRLAVWAMRRRRGREALVPRGYPVGGLVIAATLLLVSAVGAAIASRPPETVGGNAPASTSCPGRKPFDVYYLGPHFRRLPLAEVLKGCSGNDVEFGYGECSYDSCEQQPIEVRSAPTCTGMAGDPGYLRLLSDGSDPQDDAFVLTRVLGTPAIREGGGEGAGSQRYEVYTGRTVVEVTGESRHQVELAVRALRPAPGKFVPIEGSSPLYEFSAARRTPVRRLPRPPPGLFEGKVCTAIAEERKRRRERIREERRRREG